MLSRRWIRQEALRRFAYRVSRGQLETFPSGGAVVPLRISRRSFVVKYKYILSPPQVHEMCNISDLKDLCIYMWTKFMQS